MVVLEQKSSPCYKICIRGWEEFHYLVYIVSSVVSLTKERHGKQRTNSHYTNFKAGETWQMLICHLFDAVIF
ncbi:hypothetical protein BpHYR1_011019 [Brachionus plicatilis]|uniref:Uncharacterized protein n=1 Tax=Brachionus plicatilis TaxID=10195 RepID=A0A3M7P447_BRAPC|nr:hypothetical protein BpHYR1_011019 [Brachionus plicatilis]